VFANQSQVIAASIGPVFSAKMQPDKICGERRMKHVQILPTSSIFLLQIFLLWAKEPKLSFTTWRFTK